MSNRGWLLIFLDIWVNFYVIAFLIPSNYWELKLGLYNNS